MRNYLVILFLVILLAPARAQRIYLVAGGPQDGQTATHVELSIGGMATAPDGTIYFTSGIYSTIRKIDPATGTVSRVLGSSAYSYVVNGTTIVNDPSPPTVVRVGPGNVLYFDEDGARIKKVDSNGNDIVVVGATIGFAGDNGSATSAKFAGIQDFVFDASGNMYIADNGNARIRKVDAVTGIVTTIAGNGSYTLSGDGGLAVNAGVYPRALALDGNGNLYFSDVNNLVRRVNLSTGVVNAIAGTGAFGSGGDGAAAINAQLSYPHGLAITGDFLYIADLSNDKIRKVVLSTGIISTAAGTGSRAFGGDGGPATSASFFAPQRLAIDQSGNLLITDTGNDRIRKITGSTITTIAGNKGYGGDGGPGTAASINQPNGIVQTSDGDLLFSDTENNRIRKIDHITGTISTVAGDGNQGSQGDGGLALSASINSPAALKLDQNGNILFCDQGNSKIRRIDVSTGVISTIAGIGVAGDSGEGALATSAQLNIPFDLVVNSAGDIFITDKNVHKVKRIDHSTGKISTIAGDGTAGDTGDNGPAISARLNDPRWISLAPDGGLLVTDYGNRRIRKIDAAGIMTTVAGAGPKAFVGENATAKEALFGRLGAVAFASNGDMYFPMGYYIIKVDKTSQLVNLIVGQNPFETGSLVGAGGKPAAAAFLQSPGSIVIDANDNIIFTDPDNHSIHKITPRILTQTITFDALADRMADDLPFAISASSSANLPITFTIDDPTIARISGNTVTINKSGVVNITAKQPGDADYLPAISTTRSLTIKPLVTTGIVDEDSGLAVYPNPAQNEVFVVPGEPTTIPATIKIYNVLGQLMDERTVEGKNCSIDIGSWHAGVYVVYVKRNNALVSRTFIKVP